jgi:short-subunit dehydrogenase
MKSIRSSISTGLAPMFLGAGLGLALTVLLKRRYEFREKVVLITGGSRGLGLVLARRLGREGAKLALCARDAQELERAASDLRARGVETLVVPCDVTEPHEVQDLIHKVLQHFGKIDVLINNAGAIQVGPHSVMELKDYKDAMKIHFWAPLFTTLTALPHLRKGARIVNISSIGGKIAVPHMLPYSASKFALAGFSEGLSHELAEKGITVTTVFPGLMRTGSPVQAFFKGQNQKEYTWFVISDSLPLVSVSAESAARTIISACRRGDSQVIVSGVAKIAITLHDLFPELSGRVLSLMNHFLPQAGGIGTNSVTGARSENAITRSPLTAATRLAASRNNEVA